LLPKKDTDTVYQKFLLAFCLKNTMKGREMKIFGKCSTKTKDATWTERSIKATLEVV